MRIGWMFLKSPAARKKRPVLTAANSDEAIVVSQAFDKAFYLSKYNDVVKGGMDPLEHYLDIGWREGRDPAPWFSTLGYLQFNADVSTNGTNPFIHYVMWGKAEGRAPAPERETGTPWLSDMVTYPERPVAPANNVYDPKHMRIHWVIPDFSAGAGGHMTIFRMIYWLESFGHYCKIWINRPRLHKNEHHARIDINKSFVPLKAQVSFLSAEFYKTDGDAVVATSWETVWPVTHATGFKERFYFVQDYEPHFYAAGSLSIAAEASYLRDVACITAGPWLRKILETDYKRWTRHFWLAFDQSIYNVSTGSRGGGIPRIAVYCRQLTPRRMVEFAVTALAELRRRQVIFHVDFFGGHSDMATSSFPATNHGILSEVGLARLFNDCDIGISLSATNYSLVDLEMMACGLPLVEYDGKNTRAVFPRGVATLTAFDPLVLANVLEYLINNPAKRKSQADRALKWVNRFSWPKSAQMVEKAIKARLKCRNSWKQESSEAGLSSLGRGAPAMSPVSDVLGSIVFVGQPEYFRCAYYDALQAGGNFEFPIDSANPARRMHALLDFALKSQARTCVVFRPEWLADCDGLTESLQSHGIRVVGFSSEPVPTDGSLPHPDQTHRLTSLQRARPLPLDLLVHFDPASESILRKSGFERLICHPLPVSRHLFFPELVPIEFDACFLGRSTPHREHLLSALKREVKVIHVAHGLVDEHARDLMNKSRVVINLHCESYPNFETRVIQALRCERPLLSERLSGTWLKAGLDYSLAETPEDFLLAVQEVAKETYRRKPQTDLSDFTIDSLLAKVAYEIRRR